MSMDKYATGQRWTSEMEPELGVGIIDDVEGRKIHLRFPDSGLIRLYAAQSAPLRRVVFHPGDRVVDEDGAVLTITAVEAEGDLLIYCGDGKRLREDRLAGILVLDTPRERIMAGQRDPSRLFDLRRRILEYRCRMVSSTIYGFVGGRVDLIPHQFAIAAEVSNRQRPRVLLADETGLGKTIEAGLIMHRLTMTGRIHRILTIVPDALVVQWYVELARRFNLRFRIFDEAWRAACTAKDGDNPFEEEPLGLCGVSFLTTATPALKNQLIDSQYDLLVVDEAHHMQPEGPLFALVETLAQKIPRVILITATPGHLSSHGHFARLRMLDPKRYPSYDRFKAENQSYEQIARLVEALVSDRPIDPATLNQLVARVPITAQELAQLPASSTSRQQLIKRIIDRYGTGRVMFKTTRRMVSGFPGRQVLLLPLDAKNDGDAIRLRINQEVLQDCGLETASSDIRFADDPRVAWLEGYLRTHRKNKILLICRSAEKVKALHAELERRINAKVGRYHDEMTLVQRDRNAAWFAEPDGRRVAPLLGNWQRRTQLSVRPPPGAFRSAPRIRNCWNSALAGWTASARPVVVKIMVPFVRRTGGEILARWYHEALGALQRSVPAAGWVMRRSFGPLAALIRDPGGPNVRCPGRQIFSLRSSCRNPSAASHRIGKGPASGTGCLGSGQSSIG